MSSLSRHLMTHQRARTLEARQGECTMETENAHDLGPVKRGAPVFQRNVLLPETSIKMLACSYRPFLMTMARAEFAVLGGVCVLNWRRKSRPSADGLRHAVLKFCSSPVGQRCLQLMYYTS